MMALPIHIRDFRSETDLEAVIQMHTTAFAEELRAMGTTPEQQARWLRSVAGARMLRGRLLAALGGYTLGVLVAEIEHRVVGNATYGGRSGVVMFNNLVVAPEHRRQGVASALIGEMLTRTLRSGERFAAANVLKANCASLRTFLKLGFEVVDCGTDYDLSLPLAETHSSDLISRSIHSTDRPILEMFQRQTMNSTLVELDGSAAIQFYPPVTRRLFSRLMGFQFWRRAFERDSQPVGFVRASVGGRFNKGYLYRPLVALHEPDVYARMQQEAAEWMLSLGQTTMRVTIPGEIAEGESYANAHVWLRVAKRLIAKEPGAKEHV